MARCAYCRTAETDLYDSGVPICLACSEQREGKRKALSTGQIKTALINRIAETTAQVSAANQTFNEVIGQAPSGLPHPDGVQRIKNASTELSQARAQMMQAHKRLNDYVEHGIVPEDLKN
jgi:hypothetical protein